MILGTLSNVIALPPPHPTLEVCPTVDLTPN